MMMIDTELAQVPLEIQPAKKKNKQVVVVRSVVDVRIYKLRGMKVSKAELC